MPLFCSGDASEGGGNNDSSQSKEGWWKYTTSTEGLEHNTYIKYDASGTVLRAGSDDKEYKGSQFDTHASGLKFDTLKSIASFSKITDAELPSWYSNVWENAPDGVATITKDTLSSGYDNYTGNKVYDIVFNETLKFFINTDMILAAYDSNDWDIEDTILTVTTNDGPLSSKIKIGTLDGEEVLTLENASVLRV